METHYLVAADTSTDSTATILVGGFVLLGTLFTAVAALFQARAAKAAAVEAARLAAEATTRAADATAGASAFVATSARFAEWQEKKRAIFQQLLPFVRPGNQASGDRSQTLAAFEAAEAVAYDALQEKLAEVRTRLVSDRDTEISVDEYNTIMKLMRDNPDTRLEHA
jgi:hypothetical protein